MKAAWLIAVLALSAGAEEPSRYRVGKGRGRVTRCDLRPSECSASTYVYAPLEFAPPSGYGMGVACSGSVPSAIVNGDAGVLLSYARATVGECYSNDGQTLTQVAINAPAVSSGSATDAVLGLWVEQSRDNELRQNRDLSNNTYWTKTNMTCTRTAPGMRGNDANGASRCTATAPDATVCQTFTRGATTAALSWHFKAVNVTGALTLTRDGFSTSTADFRPSLSLTLWKRAVPRETPGCAGGNCMVDAMLSSGGANPNDCFKLAASGDVVDADFAQDEAGRGDATSPIETGNSWANRALVVADIPYASSPTVAGGGFSMSATQLAAGPFNSGGTSIPIVIGSGTVGSTTGPAAYAWLYSTTTTGLTGFDTGGVTSSGTSTLNQMWSPFSELATQTAGYHTGAAINSCQRSVCALPSASVLGTPAFTRLLLGRYSSTASGVANAVIKLVKYDGAGGLAIPAAQTGPVVWIGDSIIFGNGSMPLTPPVRLTELSGRGVVGAGVGSNVIAQCGSRWTSTYKTAGFQTLVWSCAVNDLAAGTAGATAATAAQAYLAEARALGMKVIVTGVMPWKNSSGWTAGKQTETVAYNSAMSVWAAANGATYVPTIASMGGGGGDPDVIAVAYESTGLDKIHPSVAGALQLATLVNAANP